MSITYLKLNLSWGTFCVGKISVTCDGLITYKRRKRTVLYSARGKVEFTTIDWTIESSIQLIAKGEIAFSILSQQSFIMSKPSPKQAIDTIHEGNSFKLFSVNLNKLNTSSLSGNPEPSYVYSHGSYEKTGLEIKEFYFDAQETKAREKKKESRRVKTK